MKFDKKQIALSVAGILAGLTLTYLLWRVEQNNQAAQQQAAANAADVAQSELANQQAEVASLPSVSVPAISSTPATDSTGTESSSGAGDGTDSILESIIAGFQSQNNSNVTSSSTPIGSIAALPLPSVTPPPAVNVPSLNTFVTATGSNVNSSPVQNFNHISSTGE